MSRFHESIKPNNLKFDYDLFDTVRFQDNRVAIITDYGIYDNQYWCEVCYPEGVHLGAADYFSSNPEFHCIHIVNKITGEERNRIIDAYIKSLEDITTQWSDLVEHKEELERVKRLLVA